MVVDSSHEPVKGRQQYDFSLAPIIFGARFTSYSLALSQWILRAETAGRKRGPEDPCQFSNLDALDSSLGALLEALAIVEVWAWVRLGCSTSSLFRIGPKYEKPRERGGFRASRN